MAAKQYNQSKANRHATRTTAKRKSAGKKSRVKINEDPNRELYHNEIILVITLVISLLLLLSNFNLSGTVGQAINWFTFGLFGFVAYLLPFFLFFGIAFYIANRGNSVAIRKLVSAVALGIISTALIQLVITGYSPDVKLTQYFTDSAKLKNGGGIIGGSLCRLLYPLFGTVGTYIILIALIIIFTMFLTGKAMLSSLGSKSSDSLRQIKERHILSEQEYEAGEETEGESIPKRKARTVLLKKPAAENISESEDGSNGTAGEGFFGKRKKKKEKESQNTADSFDMKEVIVSPDDDIPIQRSTPVFEPDPELKFTDINEPVNQEFDTSVENAERPGIDHDIKRLLQAAGQDISSDEASDFIRNDNDSFLQDKTSGDTSAGKSSISDKGIERESVSDSSALTSTNNNSTGATDSIVIDRKEEKKEYVFPPINLLSKPKNISRGMSDRDLKETALKLQKTLESFGVGVTITNVSCGPTVTRYELQPEQGVKVSKITSLADDIKLNLAAADVRIEAPIPGKAAVGIEVPNKENSTVMLRELIESNEFKKHPSNIAFAVGKDIGGQPVVTDIGKMPHLLIAGATGSGKSVCINTLIMSILYKAKPSDVRMIMIDPKVVELSVYNGIPHLLIPVVTDPKKASAALNWAVMEMTERYKKFADLGVRDIKGYNDKVAAMSEHQDEKYQKLPQIIIIVDELADLMMVAPGEVEDAICRLAQMARAAGLHLIIATQRPSVNVITGLIKANIPSRIAFSVSSAVDSRTIIDSSGAEKLLGKGDMLFFPSGYPKPVRVQGAFVSDKEVSSVVEFLTANGGVEYNEEVVNKITSVQASDGSIAGGVKNERDEYFIEAGRFIIEKDKASIGMLQRVYKIGFNRAARIMDQLAEAGVVGPEEGTKPRKVLMTMEEFEKYIDECV